VAGSLGSERIQKLKLRLKPKRRGENDEDDAIFRCFLRDDTAAPPLLQQH